MSSDLDDPSRIALRTDPPPVSAAERARAGSFTRREILRYAGFTGLGLFAPGLMAGDGTPAAGRGFRPSRYAATIGDARTAIAQAMAETQTPSISVALCDGERILWRETFGYIDRARSSPPGLNTMYCIGSCSKVIAAIATMILVDRGLVELDAPLVRYVADFRMASPDYRDISVRMLLSHAAGLPGTHARDLFTFAPVLDYAARTQHDLTRLRLKHRPGEMGVYCNDGFTLIEPLVAAVTGQSYPRFVRDEILAPLGMRHSRFARTLFPPRSYAPAFREDGRPWPQEFTNAYATGGLYSTPSDMTRLARMLINGGRFAGVRILSTDAVAEMGSDQTTTLSFNPVPTTRWGLGWDGVAQPGLIAAGVTVWHKNGGTLFYGSDFFVAPKERLALMITGASVAYDSGALAERILLNALAERRCIADVPASLPELASAEQGGPDAERSAMVGLYANHEQVLRIESNADQSLTIRQYGAGRWDEMATGLKRRADGYFANDTEPLVAYRTFTAEDRRYVAKRSPAGLGHYLSEMPYAQKIEPAADLSPAWQARVGQRWLVVNESDRSALSTIGVPPCRTLEKVDAMPGYLLLTGLFKTVSILDPAGSDTGARMFLKIPFHFGRDLDDLVIEARGGEEWMRFGAFLFRPAAGVPELVAGKNLVTIGAGGLAEWRTLPATGARATIIGTSVWQLYDADFGLVASGKGDGRTGVCAEGAHLLLYGAPHQVIRVRVTGPGIRGEVRSQGQR